MSSRLNEKHCTEGAPLNTHTDRDRHLNSKHDYYGVKKKKNEKVQKANARKRFPSYPYDIFLLPILFSGVCGNENNNNGFVSEKLTTKQYLVELLKATCEVSSSLGCILCQPSPSALAMLEDTGGSDW